MKKDSITKITMLKQSFSKFPLSVDSIYSTLNSAVLTVFSKLHKFAQIIWSIVYWTIDEVSFYSTLLWMIMNY